MEESQLGVRASALRPVKRLYDYIIYRLLIVFVALMLIIWLGIIQIQLRFTKYVQKGFIRFVAESWNRQTIPLLSLWKHIPISTR